MLPSRSFSAGAVACLSILAQPIAATNYNMSTTSTSMASAPTSVNSTGIATVVDWMYAGCEYDAAQFPGFSLAESSAAITVEMCTSTCSGYKYAALVGSDCYCGNVLAPTTTTFPDASCNLACPGNPAEKCGGDLLLSTRSQGAKRDLVGPIFISLYQQIVPPAGIIYTTVIATTYMTLCPGATSLSPTALTTTMTLTHCGCTNSVVPTIPMTTTVTTCGCGLAGAASSVTLTVPCTGATPAPPATTFGTVAPIKPTSTTVIYTGGADRMKLAVGVMMGAVGVAAALL